MDADSHTVCRCNLKSIYTFRSVSARHYQQPGAREEDRLRSEFPCARHVIPRLFSFRPVEGEAIQDHLFPRAMLVKPQ